MARIDALGDYIRDQRDQAQMSVRQLAAAAGVSNPYLSQIERGLRRPSADILNRLAGALRISAESLYVQAGILSEDDRPEMSLSVVDSIAADTSLSEAQRQAAGISQGLIRVAVGLEHIDDLKADLARGLKTL